MSATPVKTKAPLILPEADESRTRRSLAPGRPNVLKSGTVLQNRYRVLEVLGVGGMSTVYKARDLRFTSVDRSCAVKEMFNAGDDSKLRQLRLATFQREAALLATLVHPAIPRIYDYFELQGTVYLVLELIHGNDLETLLSQRGEPFDQATIVDWTIRLCSVLSYLHNQKPDPIIFRDLKPSNLMIRAEDAAMMLVDFGIARSFAPQQKGTMIGTEGYAPPEQYKGIADARGDVYALGATMHHLSTGNDPRAETPFTFAQRPPRKLNPQLSDAFEQIVLKCVAYSASDRFQSTDELRDALAQLNTVSVPQPSAPPSPTAGLVAAVAADKRLPTAGSNLLEPSSTPAPVSVAPVVGVSTAQNLKDDRIDWTLRTADEVRSSAAGAGGAIYVGSYDGHLYAIDETDGSVRWRFKCQSGIVSRPAPIAEMVVFGSEDRNVYAVARQSGRLIWSFLSNKQIRSSPFVDDKWVLVGSDDGHLYNIDRNRGVVTWRYKTWAPVRSSPAANEHSVILGSDDGYVYSVIRESGHLRWRFNVGAPVMSSPVIAGHLVLIGASDGAVRAITVADGKLVWSQQTGKTIIASPLVVEERVFIGSADGHMYALAIGSGAIAWKSHVCRQITSTAAVDGDSLLVGGNDAALYCLNRDSGDLMWRFGAGGAVVVRPLVTADHIVFGSLDGTIYALHRER